MDDRTWVQDNEERLVRGQKQWQEFSRRTGLKENELKTQYSAATKRGLERLKAVVEEADQDKVADNIELLGVIGGRQGAQKPTEKEEKRIKEAMQVASRVALLPVSKTGKLVILRTVAASKASYGWVTKSPTAGMTKAYTTKAWQAAGLHRMASRLLAGMVEGTMASLDLIVGVKQVVLTWRELGRARLTAWASGPGTLVHTARDWLQKQGWEEKGRWRWWHEGLREKLALHSSTKEETAHLAREGWRWAQWQKFLKGSRREVDTLKEVEYSTARVKRVRRLVLGQGKEAARRAVAYGAILSPLGLKKAGVKTPEALECPWCGNTEDPSHNHVFWECGGRPAGVRKPADPLMARLGWPTADGDLKEAEEVMAYMASVVETLWRKRHKAEEGGRTGIGPDAREDRERITEGEESSEDDRKPEGKVDKEKGEQIRKKRRTQRRKKKSQKRRRKRRKTPRKRKGCLTG